MKFQYRGMAVALVIFSILLIQNVQITQGRRIHQTNIGPDVSLRFKSFIQSAYRNARKKVDGAISSSLPFLKIKSGKNVVESMSQEVDSAPDTATTTPPDTTFSYLTEPSNENPLDIARKYLETQLELTSKGYKIRDHYTSDSGVTHVFFKQYINKIEVENGDANINIDKYGRVISFGESFHKESSTGKPVLVHQKAEGFGGDDITGQQRITEKQALVKLMAHLQLEFTPEQAEQLTVSKASEDSKGSLLEGDDDGTASIRFSGVPLAVGEVPVAPKYLHTESGDLVEVWDIQMEMEENWFHAHVRRDSGEIIGLLDWVSDASYQVFPVGVNDPEDGKRSIMVDPADKDASPYGWHRFGKKDTRSTMGNNVVAQENLDGSTANDHMKHYRPDGGKALKFEFDYQESNEPKAYLDAAITNLFYWCNVMHDLFYKYGFDEKSGNFQHDNYGRGGKGNDEVIANAQDGAGYNNANFATPPDGRNGKMRMYVWNTAEPMRDGDMEAGIIIHEYAHGISTRLTGGPSNSGCLGWGESGGMGEGWGDFYATLLRLRRNYTREMNFAMGSYAANKEKGIRKFVYSTDMEVNPSTYSFVKKFDYFGVHAKGEVWAVILYEMLWNLIDKNGFAENVFDPEAQDPYRSLGVPAGNIVALKITVDGMKMQPCRPSFVDARDSILQADEINYQGRHTCEIWKAFAKRGLGVDAKNGGHEDFTLPEECQ